MNIFNSQVGLAVQLHHLYSPRFLIDHLHALGFCVSYDEVTKFERSAAVTKNTDLSLEKNTKIKPCIQHAADNPTSTPHP